MQAAACIANGPLPTADREASFDGDSEEIEVEQRGHSSLSNVVTLLERLKSLNCI
jgi:hypothetical protein